MDSYAIGGNPRRSGCGLSGSLSDAQRRSVYDAWERCGVRSRESPRFSFLDPRWHCVVCPARRGRKTRFAELSLRSALLTRKKSSQHCRFARRSRSQVRRNTKLVEQTNGAQTRLMDAEGKDLNLNFIAGSGREASNLAVMRTSRTDRIPVRLSFHRINGLYRAMCCYRLSSIDRWHRSCNSPCSRRW